MDNGSGADVGARGDGVIGQVVAFFLPFLSRRPRHNVPASAAGDGQPIFRRRGRSASSYSGDQQAALQMFGPVWAALEPQFGLSLPEIDARVGHGGAAIAAALQVLIQVDLVELHGPRSAWGRPADNLDQVGHWTPRQLQRCGVLSWWLIIGWSSLVLVEPGLETTGPFESRQQCESVSRHVQRFAKARGYSGMLAPWVQCVDDTKGPEK